MGTILSVTGPAEIKKWDLASYEVKFNVQDGCGEFNRFIESRNGNLIDVEVEAIHKGCICTQDMSAYEASYSFRPIRRGTFILTFNQAIVDTLIVQ